MLTPTLMFDTIIMSGDVLMSKITPESSKFMQKGSPGLEYKSQIPELHPH